MLKQIFGVNTKAEVFRRSPTLTRIITELYYYELYVVHLSFLENTFGKR